MNEKDQKNRKLTSRDEQEGSPERVHVVGDLLDVLFVDLIQTLDDKQTGVCLRYLTGLEDDQRVHFLDDTELKKLLSSETVENQAKNRFGGEFFKEPLLKAGLYRSLKALDEIALRQLTDC